MSPTYAAILNLAAQKLEDGTWRWNDGSRPSTEKDRDLVLAIYGAAGELDQRDSAYWCLMAAGRRLSDDFTSPHYRVKDRTQEDVIAALRELASAREAA